MRYTDTRAVVETGFLTALIMVFTFVGVTVPFMGFLASILMPAVLVVLGARHGVRWSILATVTMGLVMSVVLTPLGALMQVMTSGIPGIVLAYGYIHRWSTSRLLVLPAVTMMVTIGIQLMIAQYVMQMEMETAYREQGLMDEQVTAMMTSVQAMLKQMAYVLLAALFMSSVVISYFICAVANIIMRRTGGEGVTLPPLEEWRVPQWTLYMFALGVLLTYWGNELQSEAINIVAYNMYALGSYMLVLQGIGCLWTIFKSYGLSNGIRLVLIFITLLMQFATMWIGILDLILNLRRRLSRRIGDE